jgi:hypothetical protein
VNSKVTCPICKQRVTGHSELQDKVCKMNPIKQFSNNSLALTFNLDPSLKIRNLDITAIYPGRGAQKNLAY